MDGASVKFKVLQADHSISCESPAYEKWKGYAWVMVLVYPIGIPLLYLCELLYHRKAINPDVDAEASLPQEELQQRKMEVRDGDASIRHLDFLFAEYEPRCYLFVVFECLRRLMLTGLLIFVYAGSLTQITVGLLLAYLSYAVMSSYSPYIEDVDDRLADVGQSQIVLVFIASLMLFIKDMDEQDGAPGDMFKGPIFSYAMIVIGTLVLVATIYTILVETCEVDPEEIIHAGLSPKKSKKNAAADDVGEHDEEQQSASEDDDQIIAEIIQEAVVDEAPALPAAWHAASSPAA